MSARTAPQALADYNAALDAGKYDDAAVFFDEFEALRDAEDGPVIGTTAPMAEGVTVALTEGGPVYEEKTEGGGKITSNRPPAGMAAVIEGMPEGSPVREFAKKQAEKMTPHVPSGVKVGKATEYKTGDKILFHTSPGLVGWENKTMKPVEAGTVGTIEACSTTNQEGYSVMVDYGDRPDGSRETYRFWTSSRHFSLYAVAPVK